VRIKESVSDQRGFALIALLALAALISAFLIASALNFTSAGISNEREDRSMSALRKAKAALIAYAASEQWQLYRTSPYFQPGALPCPDQDDDGDADCIGSNTASMIGRVPFKTLGIDDLRDASGERLWYALSHDFRKFQCTSTVYPPSPSGCTMINSDTLGQLTVTGLAPAAQVVAIVFAPGAALDLRAVGGPLQDRIAGHNDSTNYLENVNLGDNIHFTFTSTGLPTDTSNDRLLVITQADLMAVVEPVVAARVERDIGPLIQDYFTKWSRYPFAAPFDITGAGPGREPQATPDPRDRAQSAYTGASSQTTGLLPLSNTPTFTWGSATVTSIVGSGTGRYDGTITSPPDTISPNPTNCTIGSSPLRATCIINYVGGPNDRPDIKLEIFLTNANLAFADIPSPITAPQSLTMVNHVGLPLSPTAFGQWSDLPTTPPPSQNPPTQSIVAQLAGGVLTYTGRLQNEGTTGNRVTITVPLPAPPSYLPIISGDPAVNPTGAWFILNQWYRQTYYAISPGYAPGGVGACNPPVPTALPCLTVNNLASPTNNKKAILVFAGRPLNSSTRPSANPADYLEGQNSTPADLIFEHRSGVPTTINDRVVVLSLSP